MLNKETIKSFLWDSAITDETVAQIEQMAIGYINSHLCYKISEETYIFEANSLKTETYLPQYPITEIVKIQENNGTIFNEDFADYADGKRIIGTAGKILTETNIYKPVKITYKAGYKTYKNVDGVIVESTAPDDIKTAILLLCKEYYIQIWSTGDLKTELVDGDRVEFFSNDARIKQINWLLDNYFHYDVVA